VIIHGRKDLNEFFTKVTGLHTCCKHHLSFAGLCLLSACKGRISAYTFLHTGSVLCPIKSERWLKECLLVTYVWLYSYRYFLFCGPEIQYVGLLIFALTHTQ